MVFVVNLNDNLVMDVRDQLRAIRERARLSQEDAARRMGLRRQSSYQYWEEKAKGYLSSKMVARCLKVYVGRGRPPVTREEVLALGEPLLLSNSAQETDILNAWSRIGPAKRGDVLRILDIIASWEGGDDSDEISIREYATEDKGTAKRAGSYRRETVRKQLSR